MLEKYNSRIKNEPDKIKIFCKFSIVVIFIFVFVFLFICVKYKFLRGILTIKKVQKTKN